VKRETFDVYFYYNGRFQIDCELDRLMQRANGGGGMTLSARPERDVSYHGLTKGAVAEALKRVKAQVSIPVKFEVCQNNDGYNVVRKGRIAAGLPAVKP